MDQFDLTAIGLCSWDRMLVVDTYPGPGEYAIVRHQSEQPGGTTSNTCAALARLGFKPQLVAAIGSDAQGEALAESLVRDGCDVQHLLRKDIPTDSAVIVVSGRGSSADRTIFWQQGARLAFGDHLPMGELLDRRWILVDVDDHRLRSFLLDFPAHQSPRTRLIGAMTYLVEMSPQAGLNHAFQHDYLVGNERELQYLARADSFDDAVATFQSQMPGTACRAAFVSRGAGGSVAIHPGGIQHCAAFSIDVVDTTGAGDAFAAGTIFGIISGWEDAEILQFGNAVGGLACRKLGARASLPSRSEVDAIIHETRSLQ
ncbi:MAG: carbohydrate kinase family protein [Chloroflexota bacterium]